MVVGETMKTKFNAKEARDALDELLNLQVIAIEYSHGEKASDAIRGYKEAYAEFVAELEVFDGVVIDDESSKNP